MIEKAINPLTSVTLLNLTQKCKTANQLKQIHAQFIKLNLFADAGAVASFIATTTTSTSPGLFAYARVVFQNLRYRSTFQYNNMIRGYVQSNLPIPAIQCFKNMLQENLIRNCYTFPPLVKACSMVANEFKDMGLLVHSHLVKTGFHRDLFISSALIEFYALNLEMGNAQNLFGEMSVKDVVLWTNMIDGYGKIGDVEKARALFDEMSEKNVICWSAIIAAYSRISDFKEVLCLYQGMEEMGLKPNESILVSALTACAHLGALGQGLWIHSYANQCNFKSNIILSTALVDMYSKCGCVQLALRVFGEIHEKDSGAWNAIISGVAMNGDAMKSLELFDEMVSSGTQPTEATFVSILCACTHAKLVDKGISLFESMHDVYNIKPRIEHFSCIIDLLARSGKVEEAEKFIDEKVGGIGEGDANIGGALLGACRIYGKVDIGDRVWRKLTEKGVADYGNHVLAYNMYMEAGWITEANIVRRLMKQSQLKKNPGCSAIEVNGIVEEFLAGDKSHPQRDKIYKVLDSLFWDESYPVTLHGYV